MPRLGVVALIPAAVVAAKESGLLAKAQTLLASIKLGDLTGKKQLTTEEVWTLCKTVIDSYDLKCSPTMALAMCWIESSYIPFATRYEPHIKQTSYGLMQVLDGLWSRLYYNFGYDGIRMNAATEMVTPIKGIYMGCCYVDYLRRKFPGASEERIVRMYNGGETAWRSTQTLAHWNKYAAAKPKLLAQLSASGINYS